MGHHLDNFKQTKKKEKPYKNELIRFLDEVLDIKYYNCTVVYQWSDCAVNEALV